MLRFRRENKIKKMNNKSMLTLGQVINIHDAINFDFGFPELRVIPEHLTNNVKLTTTNYSYTIVDRETLKEGEVIKDVAYRTRLKGISESQKLTNKEKFSADVKTVKKRAKNDIIAINRETGGIFLCKVYRIDIYNRLLVELFHPVTGISITEMLLEKYPEIYCAFK